MLVELSSAIDSILRVSELIRAANTLRNFNEIAPKLAEANAQLLETQNILLAASQAHVAASKRIGDLEREICELKNIKATKERYELYSFASGMLSYTTKEGMEGTEPAHYLCAACYDKDKITKLQPAQTGRVTYYICHEGHPQIKA